MKPHHFGYVRPLHSYGRDCNLEAADAHKRVPLTLGRNLQLGQALCLPTRGVGDTTKHLYSRDQKTLRMRCSRGREYCCPNLRLALCSPQPPSHKISPLTAGALLAALVAGDAAEDFERADPKESARKVLEVLRSMFAPKGVNIPAPLQVPLVALQHCTRQKPSVLPTSDNTLLGPRHCKVTTQQTDFLPQFSKMTE